MKEGLRQGTDGFIQVWIFDGYEELNMIGKTVTATAKFKDSTSASFAVTVEPVDLSTGRYIFRFAGANLGESGTLAVEWTSDGGVNPPSAPILVPVRAEFEPA